MNGYEKDKINEQRELAVYKRDDMVQQARYKLSIQEQRAILYAISKIKPDDTAFEEYEFDIKNFYALCGIEKDTYTTLKDMLGKLSDKGWWLRDKATGSESRVRWFNKVVLNKKSGIVKLKFHEDMMPYLLQLVEQGEFYTSYSLKYVLPMSSKHSPRLYELLKSYQKNNRGWYFEINQLKRLMDCENYTNYKDFRVRVLTPAIEEINKYTDICVAYDEQRSGRKVTHITFYLDEKTDIEKFNIDLQLQLELDGQLDIERIRDENRKSNKSAFIKERMAAKKEAKGE